MNANATLLQMKYARVVSLFAKQAEISLNEALTFFYHSNLYQLVKNGVSDMHCMSDLYLAEDLQEELEYVLSCGNMECSNKRTSANEE